MSEEFSLFENNSSFARASKHEAVHQRAVRAMKALQGFVDYSKQRLSPSNIERNFSSNLILQQLLDESLHHMDELGRLERDTGHSDDQKMKIYTLPTINERLEDLMNENLALKAELFACKRRMEICYCEINDLVRDKLELSNELENQRETVKKLLKSKHASSLRSRNERNSSKRAAAQQPLTIPATSTTDDNPVMMVDIASTRLGLLPAKNSHAKSQGTSHAHSTIPITSSTPYTSSSSTINYNSIDMNPIIMTIENYPIQPIINNESSSSSSQINVMEITQISPTPNMTAQSQSNGEENKIQSDRRILETKVKYRPSIYQQDTVKDVIPQNYIGRQVRRRFGALGYFTGLVVSYKKPYFLIRYEDKDQEEMSMNELAKHLVSLDEPNTRKRNRSETFPDHSLIDYSISYHVNASEETAHDLMNVSPIAAKLSYLEDDSHAEHVEIIEIDASDDDIESIDSNDFQVITNPRNGELISPNQIPSPLESSAMQRVDNHEPLSLMDADISDSIAFEYLTDDGEKGHNIAHTTSANDSSVVIDSSIQLYWTSTDQTS